MQKELNIPCDKPIILFGAGNFSRFTMPYFIHNKRLKILGAAVSEGAETMRFDYPDIPLRNIDEWKEYAGEAAIVINTYPRYHKEIEETCRSLGFSHIIAMSMNDLKTSIAIPCYEDFFQKKGVSTEGDCIEFHGMRFVNPMKHRVTNGTSMLFQIGALVFPQVFQDYRFASENPYDWPGGDVGLSRGDVVIDLGANVGVFSVYAASRGCVCHAFEPCPPVYSVLEEHARINQNIFCYPMAVADKAGTAAFTSDEENYSAGSLLLCSSGKTMQVPQISLDGFVREQGLQRVDFIKADIEGAERYMLEGAKQTLAKFAPQLSLCTYHLPDDREVMTKRILDANPDYQIKYCEYKLYAHV